MVLLVLLMSGFLAAGSVVLAEGALVYKPVGKSVAVKLSTLGSRPQTIFYNCQGGPGASAGGEAGGGTGAGAGRDTIILSADASPDGGGSAGTVGAPSQSFLPLQASLVRLGWRVCSFDPPGLGSSGPWYSAQAYDPLSFYDELFTAIAGPGPYVLVVGRLGTVFEQRPINPKMQCSLL